MLAVAAFIDPRWVTLPQILAMRALDRGTIAFLVLLIIAGLIGWLMIRFVQIGGGEGESLWVPEPDGDEMPEDAEPVDEAEETTEARRGDR